MGVSALQSQLSAVSISSKSSASFTLPMSPPRQASCTATVSLRSKDPKPLDAMSWDWTTQDVALLKGIVDQEDAEPVYVLACAAYSTSASAKPSASSMPSAAAPKSALEKLLNFVTVMWTGGSANFRDGDSAASDDDPRIPYWQQMDAFAAAFGPMPMASAVTGAAPLGAAYSSC